MAYLGNNLQVAFPSYRIIDDISSQFNGVLKTFALKVQGFAPEPFPINPQQCLISVNNIVQKPDSTGASGFTLTGTNIVFATAPTSGWSFFGTILAGADYVNVGANFPSGSATVPSVTFDQSTGTGLFLASTNVLGIATSGVQRLTVDSSGKVGIGTTSPSQALEVAGAAVFTGGVVGQGAYIYRDGGTGGAAYSAQTGDILLTTPGSNNIRFTVNGTERARIDTSGRLLVGTITAVTARVQIQGVTGSSVYTTEGLAVAVGGNTVNPNGRGVVADFSAGGISDPATTYGVTINLGASSVGQWGIRIVPGGAFAISDYYPGGSYVGASNPPTERLRIDSSGRLLVGTSTPIASDASIFQVAGGDGARPRFHRNINDNYESAIRLSKARGTGFEIVSNNDDIGVISFQGANGSALNECASIKGSIDGSTISSTSMPGRLVFSTTADGAASPTERMRITSRGDLLLGSTPPSANARFTLNVAATGNNAIAVRDIANTADHWTLYIGANATTGGWNGAATINYCSRDTGTGRSINAAGTINASGADYAEYMVKAGEFEIAKGDVCGVTADGKLTNVFADAVGFLVKSTNPSYVGGDIWGTEDAIGAKPGGDEPELLAEWEATLEAERQKFDRIAFAGQVPVNVIGATPGQYVVPVATEDGGIVGVAKNKSEMTPAEYMDSVGKVIAIEDDGRARIIVKVA